MKHTYMIYRMHTGNTSYDRTLFAWTGSKILSGAFLSQRDSEKYAVNHIECDRKILMSDRKLIIVKLQSRHYDEATTIITTKSELMESEIRIQKMFKDLARLGIDCDSEESIENRLRLFINLKPEYADALHDIGYRPPELGYLFDSVDDEELETSNLIEGAYGGHPMDDDEDSIVPDFLGRDYMGDDYKKVLYSLENFISVMADDM